MLTLTAATDDDGRRLDRILRKVMRDLPLSTIHRLLRQGLVLVNGEKAGADRRVRAGEKIMVNNINSGFLSQKHKGAGEDAVSNNHPKKFSANLRSNTVPTFGSLLREEKVTDLILFEGSGLLALNKPSGLAVHGMKNEHKESLEDWVRSYLAPKMPPSLSFRSGPLHRLDKPSSGIIVFSTSLEGARMFSSLIRDHKIKKKYLALVEGPIKESAIWEDELIRDSNKKKTFISQDGEDSVTNVKTAITKVRPLAENPACTLILAEIETGRTHQIRAQAASHGHPLLGDRKYGGHNFPGRNSPQEFSSLSFFLHAWRMESPEGNSLPGLIEAPLPGYFQKKIVELFGPDKNILK